VSGIGGWGIAARLWRQMDRAKQARSEGDALVIETEAGAARLIRSHDSNV
jgi:hypothetical protein